MEMGEMGEAEALDDVETSFMNISAEDSQNIHQLEETLLQYTGDSQVSQRERLKRSEVTAWLDEIEFKFDVIEPGFNLTPFKPLTLTDLRVASVLQ